ncbi:hypothetical protein LTR53_015826 [Teratosphaeriaceae sp. CCFEE 6253]|nr:hypothetical protein LTR53_015826 [Teratosphaeriaceae sp. CCFEE 6253]
MGIVAVTISPSRPTASTATISPTQVSRHAPPCPDLPRSLPLCREDVDHAPTPVSPTQMPPRALPSPDVPHSPQQDDREDRLRDDVPAAITPAQAAARPQPYPDLLRSRKPDLGDVDDPPLKGLGTPSCLESRSGEIGSNLHTGLPSSTKPSSEVDEWDDPQIRLEILRGALRHHKTWCTTCDSKEARVINPGERYVSGLRKWTADPKQKLSADEWRHWFLTLGSTARGGLKLARETMSGLHDPTQCRSCAGVSRRHGAGVMLATCRRSAPQSPLSEGPRAIQPVVGPTRHMARFCNGSKLAYL